MATLAFAAVGSALGGALLPAGISVLGTTLTGAAIGAQIGAIGGGFVDQILLGGGAGRSYEGPRLTEFRVTGSTEGAPMPRVYGRTRIGGQIIWAAEIEEQVNVEHSGGGKGGLGGGATTTSYTYFASFAVGLSEGEIAGLGRIWADNEELDQSNTVIRLYTGSETQSADPLIVAHEGSDQAPAYRGLAYIVFERLPITPHGNRIPQLSFEIVRPVGGLADDVRSLVLIPGSGEFVYATTPITRDNFIGSGVGDNVHTLEADTDWNASINQLQRELPNLQNASLVTSWFGDDLRAANCAIRPGVERRDKTTKPYAWNSGGETRQSAYLISETDGRPSYGGTPADATIVEAIADLGARGIAVTLTPFIVMDIPAGNALPDPYTLATGQAPFPWRGRITIDPAPGVTGSPDQTAAAATQVATFVGTATPADFQINGTTVTYSGPNEWSYRRFILHYAHLAKAAGGVDAFVIGSELRSLTQARSAPAAYPFVDALKTLAADVKALLGSATKVTYAADWSEYFGHQPTDGSGDVYFHLDPLWASPDIDAIGIDVYWPLSDWRNEPGHLDSALYRSIYDPAYLKSNLAGGEGFDWYYASAADRDTQTRTPITDGNGKPWVFRYKDLAAWWTNPHYDRPGGIEIGQPTTWVPQSKPIWFLETGCPAVDKGSNTPNRFFDPKSSESALPNYGHARRDDLIQRNYIRAVSEGFNPTHSGYVSGINPTSALYGAPMVDPDRIYIYAWDARPFPAFPADKVTWSDGDNWQYGHWLNGRLSAASLDGVIGEIAAGIGQSSIDAANLFGLIPGYVIDRIMSPRDAIEPLANAYFLDSVESEGIVRFAHRGLTELTVTLTDQDVVETAAGAQLLTLSRGQETELPRAIKLRYVGAAGEYRQLAVESRRSIGASSRVSEANLPIMLDTDQAQQIAEAWLHETWVGRERAKFAAPPSQLALEPGDLIEIAHQGRTQTMRITDISDHGARDIEARAIDPETYTLGRATPRSTDVPAAPVVGTAAAAFLDLPLLRGDESETAGYIALAQAPWPGTLAIYQSPDDFGYQLAATAVATAIIGETLDDLAVGVEGRIDYATHLTVKVIGGQLQSAELINMLNGTNVAAVRAPDDNWEVLQFQTATLVDEATYELSGLLRAQAGTEDAMAAIIPAGAQVVVIGTNIVTIDLAPDQINLPLNWRYGPARLDIGHPSYAQVQHAFVGRGRKPLSPVHVRGARTAADLTLTWIRRTRFGGDSWETAEVPLGETSEAYEIDILDNGTVVRTLSTTAPTALYTAAQQTADFGAPQSNLVCEVFQISAVVGRGTGRRAIV
jgi:GTA TIM-barrel-like domain/Putative phage tail protein